MHPYQSSLSDTEERALALDGLSTVHGSMVWPSPLPAPLRERAALVAQRIPTWAIAAGITAGWVWSGIGRAEPWTLMAPRKPSPSALARQEWRPRLVSLHHTPVRELNTLTLLTPEATVRDLLITPSADEVAAAQLYLLADSATIAKHLQELSTERKPTLSSARRRAHLVGQWWKAHPLVTR